ncbi:LCP family protein [Streptomyces sp. NPDC087658]|uniref:LCP family protein n=1 Tax=Streptomyces sp. NPDC087658 TaxID=3365800 RepID=UPI003815E486
MDEDVTDSAGTPPEPDEKSAESGKTGGSEGSEGSGSAGTSDAADTADSTASSDTANSPGATNPSGTTEDTPEPAADTVPADTVPAASVPAASARPKRKRRWLRWVAVGTSVAVLAAGGAGWWFYQKLDGNITTDTSTAAELETYEKDRPQPVALDAENILLIGSDSRAGKGNGKYGQDDGGSQRSDTTILLHLAADRKSATAVSFPRDLMVDTPSCRRADGTRAKERFAQFNWAFEAGGAACSIRTIEKLTGIRVDHHMVIDFNGFKDMVDAVDGVEVCLKEPVDDSDSKLKLPAGRQILDGEQALGYVRVRKSLGDGSDTQRISRQQGFLGALFKKVQSDGVLLDPTQLYPVLNAATKSLTTDPGLGSLSDLYDLTRSMRSVPAEKVQFLTAPRQQYRYNANRDELVQPDADLLFEQLRDDKPISVSLREKADDSGTTGDGETTKGDETAGGETTRVGETASGAPNPSPTFSGTNASVGVCE